MNIDEELPFVKFARLAGWTDDQIACAVACHERGEAYEIVVTFGSRDGLPQPPLPVEEYAPAAITETTT